MHYELMKLKKSMDMKKYTLKDLALYFEKFDGYICKITTDTKIIKFKFTSSALPHMIGMQYAFANRKDSKKYGGESGFELLKNGTVTYEMIKQNVRNNNVKKISWKNIDERIKILPMFLNSLQTSKIKLKTNLNINENRDSFTHLKGNYFLYRKLYNGSLPMFSLRRINKYSVVLETFIVDNDNSIINGLKELKIKKIELIEPLEVTKPIIKREKDSVK